MVFEPNNMEFDLIRSLLNIHNSDFSLIRLTPTMLEKSIIDANGSLRTLLKKSNIVDYNELTPGGEKRMLPASFITSKETEVTISYYRPKTKKGDPRFWIYGLKKHLRSGEMIYITTYNERVYIIPLVEHFFSLDILTNIFSNTSSNQIVDECIELVKQLANQDILSVSPYALHPRDIGDTLEYALNICPNTRTSADYKDTVELKAKRKGVNTRDTLFSMVPNWNDSLIQSSSEMILTYGYSSTKYSNYIDLYVTVSNRPNRQGLYLDVDYDNELIIQKYIDMNSSITDTCIWHFEDVKKRLYQKHPETLWVIGEKIDKCDGIYFRYETIEHTRLPNFSSFLLLISEGIITFDWRGRLKEDGTGYKDKGHCFRLKPGYRNMLFGETETISI